jgi:hypothetical protein
MAFILIRTTAVIIGIVIHKTKKVVQTYELVFFGGRLKVFVWIKSKI